MTKSGIRALLKTGLRLCGLVLGLAVCSPAPAQEVIVNPDVADRSVSQSSLRAIFSMRMRQWQNGKPIKVFVLPSENTLHVSFSKSILNTFPYQLKRSWDLMVYSGSGQAPTEVGSPAEMLLKVSSTPGAIGYMPEDYLIEGGKNGNIRILEVR